MTITGLSSQAIGAGTMDLRVALTDADAKAIMVATPNVTVSIGYISYPVYEVNPTVVPNVYAVRLTKLTTRGVEKDSELLFEV